LRMLTEGVKRMRENGIAVWLVGMNPTVFAMIQKSRLAQMLGSDAMHFNLEIAVARFLRTAEYADATEEIVPNFSGMPVTPIAESAINMTGSD